MKKIITILALSLTTILTAQTSVNLSGMIQDVTLGQNCSNSQAQEVFITTGDVNLNGKTLDLRNAYLISTGNITGPGRIEGCGNSKICTSGIIQNNPIFDNVQIVNCSNLELPEFEFSKFGYKYKVVDLLGRTLQTGITSEKTASELPINQVILFVVEGFKVKKLLIN